MKWIAPARLQCPPLLGPTAPAPKGGGLMNRSTRLAIPLTDAPPEPDPTRSVVAPVPRLALRLDEVAAAVGMSRRAIEREKSAGRLPPPDKFIGKCPVWSVE